MNKEQIFDIRINTACGKKCGWFKEGLVCICGIKHIENRCLLFDIEMDINDRYWLCRRMCLQIEKQQEADEL
jgi:hypothetical protein